MRRLYLQIYLAVLAVLVLFAVLTVGAWRLLPHDRDEASALDEIAELVSAMLPDTSQPAAHLQQVLDRIGPRASTDITVYTTSGETIAQVGNPVPAPQPDWRASHWLHRRGGAPTLALRLTDGRWLVVRHQHDMKVRFGWTGIFVLLALAVGIGAYPVARRLTGRLERLQQRVDALGAGDLSARIDIEGRDEIADLARSFNRAAERIETLLGSQRKLLANASHELRSPLARLRMAIELLSSEQRPDLHARIEQDIAELDELIGELLLASRLESQPQLTHSEPVDLFELATQEAELVGAKLVGQPTIVNGDARLLKRLLRNLLENARRYGAGAAIEVSVGSSDDGKARLSVCDRGPGVAPSERERIFEPFYRLEGSSEHDGGVGLGLSLVRQIARHHGGDVRCVPREGGGSCFEVTL